MPYAYALCIVLTLSISAACSGTSTSTAPTPVQPSLDPRLRAVSQGTLDLDVAPGQRQAIDPLALASEHGTPPTCAGFVFLFSWSTARSRALRFAGNRQGAEFDIGSGAPGQASVTGCILLEAVNDTSERVTGQLRYVVAEATRP